MRDLSTNEIKEFNKLYLSKYRKQNRMFIIEGNHLVKEAYERNLLVKAYTIDENFIGELISESSMKKICKTDTLIRNIGICKFPENSSLSNKILVLDQIQDPGNMGTLLRTAKAFGFDTIVCNIGTVDCYNDKVIRSSQGAIFKLNIIYTNLVEFMKNNFEYTFIATDVVSGCSIEECQQIKKLALILGNEGNGISNEVKELANNTVTIKMNDTESLNVAIAGGILMYLLK